MKKTKSNFCLVITVVTVCDFFENLCFWNNQRQSLATRVEYPTKNTTSFKVGDQVVVVGKISEVPIGQLFKDYHATSLSKIKNEDTYFFMEDHFYNISYFEIGQVYEVAPEAEIEDWRSFFWKLISINLEGDKFLK